MDTHSNDQDVYKGLVNETMKEICTLFLEIIDLEDEEFEIYGYYYPEYGPFVDYGIF